MGMKRVSIAGANRYDRMDRENWILVPRYTDVKRTSFLDVMSLALYNDQWKQSEVKSEEIYNALENF